MGAKFQIGFNKGLLDLNPINAGQADLAPGHVWGPGSVGNVLIHKVLRGQGTLYCRGQTHHLTAGDAFIIMPGEVAKWIADKDDPWSYQWIGFGGRLAAEFSQLPSPFPAPEWMFSHLSEDITDPDDNLEYMLAGDLMHLYGTLIRSKKQRQDHALRAIEYIRAHFSENLTIQQISDHVGLNRDYLARLFKRKTGRTLQEQITKIRIEEAYRCLYLDMSVKEAAMYAGFRDTANFSKLFKKMEGISPKQWKKEIHDPNSHRRFVPGDVQLQEDLGGIDHE